jgi:hypothetical protein
MEFLDNPAWLLSSDDHHKLSLSKFSVTILRDAALSAKIQPMAQFKTKALLINGLVIAFLNTRKLVMSKSTSDILPLFSRPPSYTSRSDLLSKYFSSIFGDIISSAFRIPQSFPKTELTPSSEQLLSDLLVLVKDESFELKSSRFLTKKTLQNLINNLHPSRCPSYSSTFASRLTAITESFCARCENLMFANQLQIIGCIICWEPSFTPVCDWSFHDLILYLLKIEYSSDLVNCLTHTK